MILDSGQWVSGVMVFSCFFGGSCKHLELVDKPFAN